MAIRRKRVDRNTHIDLTPEKQVIDLLQGGLSPFDVYTAERSITSTSQATVPEAVSRWPSKCGMPFGLCVLSLPESH